MLTKDQALYALAEHPDLCEIYELAPGPTEVIIDLALTCDDPAWCIPDMALLSLIAGHIAGPDATHLQLRTARHEEALIAFIDYLLPDEIIGEMEVAS